MSKSKRITNATTMITLPILSPMAHAGAGAKKAQNDLFWPSWMPYAVACRLDESTWTSLLNMVPVPSHDAHHCPFDRAELPGARLLSSGSPTVLMNAEGRQLPLHPEGLAWEVAALQRKRYTDIEFHVTATFYRVVGAPVKDARSEAGAKFMEVDDGAV